jgi:hypothetical protein
MKAIALSDPMNVPPNTLMSPPEVFNRRRGKALLPEKAATE